MKAVKSLGLRDEEMIDDQASLCEEKDERKRKGFQGQQEVSRVALIRQEPSR